MHARYAAHIVHAARGMQAAMSSYFRLSGTPPPDSINFAMTCLCSHTFISADRQACPCSRALEPAACGH